MRGTIFWDVDTQHDLLMPAGKVYVPGAEALLPNLGTLTRFARERGIPILGSVDYHNLEDEEISDQPDFLETYPAHCLAGSPGQEKVEATRPRNPLWIESRPEDKEDLKARVRDHLARGDGEVLFRKQRVDVFSNPNVDTVLDVVRPGRVVVYGVSLDCSDRCAVEGLLQRKRFRVAIVRDAAHPRRAEEAQPLLDDWASRGVCILTTDQVIGGALGV
jgi:nicotinamidase/pyrazinamidase